MAIKEKDIKEFVKHAKALDKLIRRVRKNDCPEANYYLANDHLHLMKGPSHIGNGIPQQNNVVETVDIYTAGGGDW